MHTEIRYVSGALDLCSFSEWGMREEMEISGRDLVPVNQWGVGL